MDISMLLKITLLLVSCVLLVTADHSPAARRGKKERQKGQAKGKSPEKAKLWLSFDSAGVNLPDTYPISPDRSISPWKYEVSYDESRIPSHIYEAKCETVGCIDKDGNEDVGLESKPIFYQILVLRRVKGKKKKYSFQLEAYTTSVGCTCVLPTVI